MSKKNLGYFHAAVPSAALAAAVPYLSMKKKDGESEEQFKARRRGLATALGVVGGVAGGHFIPPALIKSAGYFDEERKKSQERLKENRKKAKTLATMFTSEKDANERAKLRAKRRKEGFVESGILSRGAMGLAGTALASKNIPLLAGAKGTQMLYHGTGSRGLQGILADDPTKGGIRLEHAGTKGRLNSHLMPNAVVRQMLEEQGLNVSNVELATVQTRLANRIEQNKGTPIVELIKDEMGSIGSDLGLPDKKVQSLQGGIKDRLREAGMRIYFGNSPEKVVTWHDDLNELDKLKRGFINNAGDMDGLGGQAKNQLKMQLAVGKIGADLATGGIMRTAKDVNKQHDYLKNLQVHSTPVSRQRLREIAAAGVGGDASKPFAHVLGANIPSHDVQELADFKGLKLPLRLSPGLQSVLGSIPGFEGYDPTRDISTGLDVAQDAIKHVDLVDPDSGKATRYLLDSYKAPKLTGKQRLRALGRAAVPLALTGLGADMIYRAASGRKGLFGTALSKLRSRKKGEDKKKQTKTASKRHRPLLNAVKNIGKYGVPTVGAGIAYNVGMDALGRKIIPVTEPEYAPLDLKDEIEGVARETTRATAGSVLKNLAGFGVAAGGVYLGRRAAINAVRKRLPELTALAKSGDQNAKKLLEKAELIPGMVGAGAGSIVPSLAILSGLPAAKAYMNAARGQDATRAELGTTPEEQMKSPWKSAVLPTLATLGVAGGVMASGAKYFPGLIRRGELQMLANQPAISPSATREHLELALENAKRGKAIPKLIQDLARGVSNDGLLKHKEHENIRKLAKEVRSIAKGVL